MLRGIEKKRIFDDALDWQGFVSRIGKLALETQTKIDAWSLLSNLLLLRSGPGGLTQYMRPKKMR